MLYEMITGELPFPQANAHAMMRAKVNQEPRPPHEVKPDIDPKVEEIILRAIDRLPRERYASAKEMLADLEDPSRVEPRDRSGERPTPLLERLRVPRAIIAPVVLSLVVGTLLVLTWVMGNSAGRRQPTVVPLPASAQAPGRGR